MTTEAKLQTIPVDKIDAHPKNPRLVLREDVIEGIRAQLNGHMAPEHALRVRPKADRFELVGGHQRIEAARRAGIAEVPCWVREMDDDAAYMALVLDNAQGELGPLEIGLHALECVGKSKGGKGKKGGLAEYARLIGRDRTILQKWVAAAEVAKGVQRCTGLDGCTQHLNAIHALPPSLWSSVVSALLENEWSVKDTEVAVAKAKEFLHQHGIPKNRQGWLDPEGCAAAVALDKLGHSDISRLLKTCEETLAKLEEAVASLTELLATQDAAIRPEVPDFPAQWLAWLHKHKGGKSWNLREVRRQRDAIDDQIAKLTEAAEESKERAWRLIPGDFREAQIEADSADWIVTDPPYPQEFLPLFADLGAFAARVLKPGGSLLVMVGQSYLPEIVAALTPSLRYQWTLSYETPGGQAVQLWDRKVNTSWKPVLWFVKGEYEGDWIGDVAKSKPNDNDKRFHGWGQSESGMASLMERFVKRNDLVVDPFLGGGTTGLVALSLGCKFLGVDVDEKAVATAETRLLEADAG